MILSLACLVAPAAPCKADTSAEDELILKTACIRSDAESLLQFFRNRRVTHVDHARLTELIRRLDDTSTDVQDAAYAELSSIGPCAILALRQAANDLEKMERAGRARKCLHFAEGEPAAELTKAAARLLAHRRPPDAVQALLAYLPFAEDAETERDIEAALAACGCVDGKIDPLLLAALQDPLPVRRAAAAEALCRSDDSGHLIHVRPMLADSKASVRLRVALSLARKHEADAIPVLIDLLADLPHRERQQAEEYLIGLAGEWAVVTPQSDDDTARRLRRDLWAAWWKATDDAKLLNEFRQRTLSDEQRANLLSWIQQLGDADATTRDRAVTQILSAGAAAAPLLRPFSENESSAIRTMANNCLQLIQKPGVTPMPVAAARLLTLRKPTAAAEVLLAYLPSAETEAISQEARSALAAVAFVDGKSDPALLAALSDPSPLRRAAAAEALCRGGLHDQRDAVYRLLGDADPTVKMQTALALVAAREKRAVPSLIGFLNELPPEQSSPAEEMLIRIARDTAPSGSTMGDPSARKSYHDAWLTWWETHRDTIQIARSEPNQAMLGLTLVIEQQSKRTNRIMELDQAGKPRWQIDSLQHAVDAQVLPGDRVLVVEQQGNRVTERDRQGKILWQWAGTNLLTANRLANGQTFVATRQQLTVIDRNGKEMVSVNRPIANIASAARLRDGKFALVTIDGQFVLIDAAGKEISTTNVAFLQPAAQCVEFLSHERLLVPIYNSNKVAEYDLSGKVLWEATVQAPSSATRLPNGNTLVVSHGTNRILEINRAGNTVWEVKDKLRPWKARRR